MLFLEKKYIKWTTTYRNIRFHRTTWMGIANLLVNRHFPLVVPSDAYTVVEQKVLFMGEVLDH
jgi:hypothetical protein